LEHGAAGAGAEQLVPSRKGSDFAERRRNPKLDVRNPNAALEHFQFNSSGTVSLTEKAGLSKTASKRSISSQVRSPPSFVVNFLRINGKSAFDEVYDEVYDEVHDKVYDKVYDEVHGDSAGASFSTRDIPLLNFATDRSAPFRQGSPRDAGQLVHHFARCRHEPPAASQITGSSLCHHLA
jgi:hypothetical protein